MKKIVIVLLVLLALGGGVFYILKSNGGPDVSTIAPVRQKAVQAVYATGTVEGARMTPIAPKLTARLLDLAVDEGSRVEAGTLLARMEDEDVRQSLSELQARLDLAQKELKRARSLSKSGAISKEALDQAVSGERAAAAAVDRAQAELSYLQLTAPESGTIIRRDGEPGEVITAGSPVFWINAGDVLRIETEVDEEDIALVQPGQPVLIRADAFPDQVFNGHVQAITLKGDPVARSYRVRVGLDDTTPLMIGMTAETNIIVAEKESALMVPRTAVDKGHVLRVAADGTYERVAVETGIRTPNEIEITSGIDAEDRLVKTYNATLLPEPSPAAQ